MKTHRGFSLTDILVSLVLLSSISIVLFKQHWLVLQYLQQLRLRHLAIIEIDNIAEYWLAGEQVQEVSKPFELQWLDAQTVKLYWMTPGSSHEESIQRSWK